MQPCRKLVRKFDKNEENAVFGSLKNGGAVSWSVQLVGRFVFFSAWSLIKKQMFLQFSKVGPV